MAVCIKTITEEKLDIAVEMASTRPAFKKDYERMTSEEFRELVLQKVKERLKTPISAGTIQDINNENPMYDSTPVKVQSGYEQNGKHILIGTRKGKRKPEEFPASTLALDQNSMDKLLGSKEDMRKRLTEKELSKFEQRELEIHGSPEKMIELLDELNELDGTKASDTHMEGLRQLFRDMDPKFFTKMNTYVRDNAKENGGVVDGKNIAISVSKVRYKDGNMQSAAEVYAHEVVHAYTRFAIEAAKNGDMAAHRALNRLEHVMKVAKENTTWEHMLGDVKIEDATDKQIQDAKDMYEYIFIGENAEHEFIAHVLTNPIVMKHMEDVLVKEKSGNRTVLDKIKGMWDTIKSLLIGDYKLNDRNKNIQQATRDLAMMFAEYNNRATVYADRKSKFLDKLVDGFNSLDDEVSAKLREFINKNLPEAKTLGPVPNDRLGKAKWMAKAIGKAVLEPEYRKILMSYLDQLGVINVAGSISSILKDFVESDELSKSVDWLNIQSDKIDQMKMNVSAVTGDNIRKAFGRDLTTEENEALTTVLLDTDYQVIRKEYTNKQLIAMLEDENTLHTKLGTAKVKLEKLDREHYGWNVNQATGLGYFMATGKAHYAQMLNSYNIARGYGSENVRKPDAKVIRAVDRVATLEALQRISVKDKKTIAGLLKDGKTTNGIKTTLDTAEFLKKEAERTTMDGQKEFMIKGYTKELFDDMVDVEVAKVSEWKQMEAKGFKKLREIEQHSMVNTAEKYAIYVATNHNTGDWNRASTRLTKNHTKGTSLKEIWFNEGTTYANKKYQINKNKIDTKRYELVDKMNKKEANLEELEYGLSPTINEYGEVVGYRFMMDKAAKRSLLKQNKAATDVLGATRATLLDKQKSKIHNENVLKLIKEDAEGNYIPGQTMGKDRGVYILIEENSTNPEVREIWKVMPPEFKREANLNKEKGLPVRKDLLHNYFGYRELTFAEFPGLSKYMPQVLKNAIKIAEAIWKEFIKIVKVDILIKMPFVLVGNIMSNMVYAITTGSTPVEIFSMYRDSVRDTRNYLKRHRELVKLQELINIGEASNSDKDRVKILERELKHSPIHELYEMGVYQAIVEDVSKEELGSGNKLKKAYKKKMENAPKLVKDGLNWMFLTEETQYYKFATEVLQMSDLVARDIENRKMKKKTALQANGKKPLPMWYIEHLNNSKNDMAKLMRLKNGDKLSNRDRKMSVKEREYFLEEATKWKNNVLINAFINYNKLSGPSEEYLNKMGFVMFTKYAKRIQKVITDTGIKYPMKSLGILLFDSYIWDMDTIQDQSIFTRSWYNMQPQYPWERVMDVMEPAIIQPTTYRLF